MTDSLIEKLVQGAGKAGIVDWDEFVQYLKKTVQLIFCFRLEVHLAKINRKIVNPVKCIKWKNDLPELDLNDLAQRSFRGHLGNDKIEDIVRNSRERFNNVSQCNFQNTLRGHDAIDVISHCMRRKNKRSDLSRTEALYRVLILFAEEFSEDILGPLG